MKKDLRDTPLYQEVEALFQAFRQPGSGQISDAAEVHPSPDGKYAVFSGSILDKLEGTPSTRICRIDLQSGDVNVSTFGPNTDRLPRYSPDGRLIAFLSDRHKAGDFQLYLLDPALGAARATPHVEGWVEYLHWSPDGKRILLGVAGRGADVAGAQGAVTSKKAAEDLPSWMPTVEIGDEEYRWRRAWIYDLATNRVTVASPSDSNIWEATWCGNNALAAVTSPRPGEGDWYTAYLCLIDLRAGQTKRIYTPKSQLGCPAASASGKHLAAVEAICSDRWIVCGDLLLIDTGTDVARRIDTGGMDVTHTEWRSDKILLLAGHQGLDSIVGQYDTETECYTEVWRSRDISTGGRYMTVAGLNATADCVLIGESFVRAPEIATIRQGRYHPLRSFDLGYTEQAQAAFTAEGVSWNAPDGLEIQGWLLRPRTQAPHPLIIDVHGGPVWHWRPRWPGRATLQTLVLAKRGYAILFPNPRGSTGRGQEFVRHVLGDMGGADTYDCLSGLDHLVKKGIADPKRLGVTGGSYGGFMCSWLITQDSRFAAAVSVAPFTNHVSEHLVSNLPHFVSLFLADQYRNPTGKYFQRSPVMHAHKATAPTLNICGALDRSTPPEEAVQFHNALLENGVKSVLVTYPEEGHGVRKLPAMIDYVVRLVSWFDQHMAPPT